MLSWLVKRPWFQLVDLICIFIATLLWSTLGHAVWWPILIALAPWILRLVTGAYPYQRTSFDLALLVFLLTAVIGFWVSYDRSAAGIKLWYIIAALFVYYALARQPKDNFWILAGGLVLLGASLSIAFLLVHDWQSQPADFDFINGIAGWWVSVRPQVSMWGFPPNQAGGILAVLIPYLLAFGWYASKQRNSSKWLWTTGAFVSIAFVLMVFGLLMTSSRAAWLALLFAFLMWSSWQISTLVVRRIKVSPRIIYATIALLLVAISLALVFTAPDQLLDLVDQIPGYPSGESRYELARNTRHLIADYPFTGGGLNSFAGLYSYYILSIPHFYYSYSHNLFLDIAMEQGVLGMVTYILILVVSAYMLLRSSNWEAPGDGYHLFRQAILFSLLIMVFHGFFDDALYGNQGTPLIFLTAGLAVALSKPADPYNDNDRYHFSIFATNNHKKYFGYAGLFSLLVLLAGTAVFYKNLMSVSFANLAAIQMGMVQLNDFPTGEWDDGGNPARLASAKADFSKALEFNPFNRIANYRMGLIAMLDQDYRTAEMRLNYALARNKHHRGVIKNLGYCYVWLGEYDNALWYLEQIPEANQELDAYTWWWESQGQRELALRAQRMKKRLDNPESR